MRTVLFQLSKDGLKMSYSRSTLIRFSLLPSVQVELRPSLLSLAQPSLPTANPGCSCLRVLCRNIAWHCVIVVCFGLANDHRRARPRLLHVVKACLSKRGWARRSLGTRPCCCHFAPGRAEAGRARSQSGALTRIGTVTEACSRCTTEDRILWRYWTLLFCSRVEHVSCVSRPALETLTDGY